MTGSSGGGRNPYWTAPAGPRQGVACWAGRLGLPVAVGSSSPADRRTILAGHRETDPSRLGIRGRCGVNFPEQPPSTQWAALKYRGEAVADVWFKPEGLPFALTFRIPQKSFQIPELGQRLTAENLLRAVGITADEVESWLHGGVSPPGMNRPSSELGHPLPPPPPAPPPPPPSPPPTHPPPALAPPHRVP